jgi:putative transcriptional regulator
MTIKIARKAPRWLAALLSIAALSVAIARAADDAPPPGDPPPGELLIASAAIEDPRFQHSVILLLRHDRTGAFGIAINHPLGTRPLAALLAGTNSGDGAGDKDAPVEGTIEIFRGGPVQPTVGFVIHSSDYRRPETLAVGDRLAMTASREILLDIGRHRGPAKSLFALGYAGWGAGQIEDEIRSNGWIHCEADPELLFDPGLDTKWATALSKLGIDISALSANAGRA